MEVSMSSMTSQDESWETVTAWSPIDGLNETEMVVQERTSSSNVSFGMGYTLEKGGLIRVNLVLSKMNPTSTARKVLEVFCCIGTLIAMGLPLWYFARSVLKKFDSGYTSGTMLNMQQWIPESFMLAGLIILWLQLLAYLLRVLSNQVDLDASRAANLGID